MRKFGMAAALLLTMGGTAQASRHCTLDLSPLVSVHSFLNVQAEPDNAPWPLPVQTRSDLLISVGGAVNLMRTDIPLGEASSRTFLSGRLPNSLLARIQAAVNGVASGPTPDCYVPSDPNPPTGESTSGVRAISLYKPFATTTFHIQHADPSETLLPACETPVVVLDRAIRDLEAAVQNGGARSLQCSPR
jgi:hypothetical protein